MLFDLRGHLAKLKACKEPVDNGKKFDIKAAAFIILETEIFFF